MAFIEISPRKKFYVDSKEIRIRFFERTSKGSKCNSWALVIGIPSELSDKIGLEKGCRVSFSYDEENTRIWLIKKANDQNSYKLGKFPKNPNFIIQMTWDKKLFIPTEMDLTLRFVESELALGGIKIDASLPLGEGKE